MSKTKLTFNQNPKPPRDLIKPLHQDPLTTQGGKANSAEDLLGITSLHGHANPLPEEHARARVSRRDHQSSTNPSNQRCCTWAPHTQSLDSHRNENMGWDQVEILYNY